jgi:hypothetical protein
MIINYFDFVKIAFGSINIIPSPEMITIPPKITSKDGSSLKNINAPIIALTGISNKKGIAIGIECFDKI